MIEKIEVGDITDPSNRRNIIIAMNSTLSEATTLAAPYVTKLKYELKGEELLGSVLSFDYDEGRKLHMLVCHHIGKGGWKDADKYVRYGLDYLDHTKQIGEQFSIVQIGTGPIGTRDGADDRAIRTAIATSFLSVTLFVQAPVHVAAATAHAAKPAMRAYAIWNPNKGAREIVLAS